jgi:hypothetical protein
MSPAQGRIVSAYWPRCESRWPPPSDWPPQGDYLHNDPLVHPSGSLRFYVEIRSFFALPSSARRPTPGRAWRPSPPQKAQIGASVRSLPFGTGHWISLRALRLCESFLLVPREFHAKAQRRSGKRVCWCSQRRVAPVWNRSLVFFAGFAPLREISSCSEGVSRKGAKGCVGGLSWPCLGRLR